MFIILIFFTIVVINAQSSESYYNDIKEELNRKAPDYSKVILLYNNIIASDSNDILAYSGLANTYKNINQYEQAITTYKPVLANLDNYVKDLHPLIYLEIGLIYYDFANSMLVHKYYTADYHRLNYDKIKNTFDKRNNLINIAKDYLKKALSQVSTQNKFQDPDRIKIKILTVLGDSHGLIGESEEALNKYREVLILNNNNNNNDNQHDALISENSINMKIGDLYLDDEKDNKALEYYSKVINKDKYNYFATRNAAFIYNKLKNYKKAIELYQKTLDNIKYARESSEILSDMYIEELNNRTYHVHEKIGLIKKDIKDYTGALDEFVNAYKIKKTKSMKNDILECVAIVKFSMQGWRPYTYDDGIVVYSDENIFFYHPKKTKILSGGMISSWVLSVSINFEKINHNITADPFAEEEYSDTELEKLLSDEFEYSIALCKRNCKTQKSILLQSTVYSPDGNVKSYSYKEKEQEWYEETPGSVGETMFNFDCKSKK